MSVESAADRAALLADFGVSVSWTVGATTSTVTAIFDHGTIPQGFDAAAGRNRRATLTLREADLPVGAGTKTDRLSAGGKTWLPKSVEPDGTGMAVVTMEEVLT